MGHIVQRYCTSIRSWKKGTPWAEETLNCEEIKPVALLAVELCLTGGVSYSISQLVKNSVK